MFLIYLIIGLVILLKQFSIYLNYPDNFLAREGLLLVLFGMLNLVIIICSLTLSVVCFIIYLVTKKAYVLGITKKIFNFFSFFLVSFISYVILVNMLFLWFAK